MNRLFRKILAVSAVLSMTAGCTGTAATATAEPTPTETAAEMTDAEKFAQEYTQLTDDNLFVYRTAEEIIQILQHGTGIVYLGFPECPWCQRYVVYLNETAENAGITKIYYYNIMDDRSDNTEVYQQMVELLGDNLLYDDEGKPRIYVPDVTFVLSGEIIGHDNTSSVVTDADGTPDQYWTQDRITELETKLAEWMKPIAEKGCSECNVEAPKS